MRTQPAQPHYLVCNADESEPGTFKDRVLMEGDPHGLVEGMILGGYAIQADIGYVFLRNEYFLAAQRLQKAIDQAYAAVLAPVWAKESGAGVAVLGTLFAVMSGASVLGALVAGEVA